LPITNRDGKIIYKGIIPLADDLLYVCQHVTLSATTEHLSSVCPFDLINFKFSSSLKLLGHFEPNFAWIILQERGFKFIQMKLVLLEEDPDGGLKGGKFIKYSKIICQRKD
jgi:hypothetical protein